MNARIQAFAISARLPGLVLCRFDANKASTESWGFRDADAGLEMNEDSLFPVASVTKTFTAHLLQEVSREGLLDLHAPIASAWPAFAHPDRAATAEMTPRDALGHLSGLPPHTWAWVFGDLSRADFFEQRFPRLTPVGPFREKHRYSNLMYAAMGQLLGEVTGKPWEVHLQNRILTPLGMSGTHALRETWADDFPNIARPHSDEAPPQTIPPFVARTRHLIAPASEMLSSAPDLARWGQFLLTLPPDDIRWRAVSQVMPGLAYGLGWRLESRGGLRRVWHSGQCTGYTSLLTLYPEQGRGCVLLCNRSNALPALQAVEAFLLDGSELPPPVSEVRKTPSPALPNFGSGRLPTGLFQNPGYGPVCLFEQDGRVWSRFQTGDALEVLQDASGQPVLQLPVYGLRFPLRAEADRLFIPFEPAVPEMIFKNYVWFHL